MKHLLLACLSILTFSAANNAYAIDRTVQAGYDPSVREVQLLIEDAVEVGRACDYHVSNMTYHKNQKILSLTLSEEACFTDVFGKKKAMFKWNLPRSLHMSSFCLRVNSKILGRITFDASNVTVTNSCK